MLHFDTIEQVQQKLTNLHRTSAAVHGFTLIELMVVVGMIAILAALAVPGLRTLVTNSQVSSLGNELVLGITFARSEAISRNKCVTICVATDITSPSPTCLNTAGEWNTGWIIFSNPKCDSVADDPTAELLKAYVGKPTGPSLTAAGTPRRILFDSRGRAGLATPASFSVSAPGDPATKMVCVDTIGRARAGNIGSISCDGTNQN